MRWAHGLGPAAPARFDPAAIAGLPAPARAYLTAAVPPGAPALAAALIEMRGSIRIGGRWLPFRAREVLAPAHGFTWWARVGGVIAGADRLRDGRGAMDWRLAGVVPLARAGGADVSRSAAGRCAAEGVWLPSALLPGSGVTWVEEEGLDGAMAVAAIPVAGCDPQTVRIRLDADGAPTVVTLDRFGSPPGEERPSVHPFGMRVTALARPAGLRIPVEGRAGWFPTARGFAEGGEFFRFRITRVTPLA